MTKKPIVTVTLNPALDLTIELEKLNPGEVNLALKGHLHPAGKGINVAMVLRDLGQQCIVTGVLGEDNRKSFDTLFTEKSLISHFLYENGSTRTNVKLSEASGRVTDINLPGLNVQQITFQGLRERLELLTKASDLFVLSGSLPKGLGPNVYAELTSMLKRMGRKAIVDTSGAALHAAIDAVPFMVKPNVEEMEQWVGRSLFHRSEQEVVVRNWLQKGIQHVVVSEGAEGVRWYSNGEAWLAQPPQVDIVSTVGAGDSLVAGLSYGLANGLDVEETLALATAVSALAVSQVGVGIRSRQVFEGIKQQVKIKPLPFPT